MKYFYTLSLTFCLLANVLNAQQWVWVKPAGGTASDYAYGVATDLTGNVYTVGSYEGTATFGTTQLTNSGLKDIFIVKYDAQGTVQWAKKAGGTSTDEGLGIAVDASGNCYVTGYFMGTASFGSTNLTSTNGKNIFIAKYATSNGALTWAKSVSVTGDAEGAGIDVDAAGNCYITGYFRNTATFKTGLSLTASGGLDAFVAKYNTSGTCLWAKKGGGSGLDRAYGITVIKNSLAITGYYESTGTFGSTQLTSAGGGDAFVAKYDTSGTLGWAKSFGGSNTDYGHAVAMDTSGNCFVSGRFEIQALFQTTTLNSYGSYDVFLAKLSNNGSLQWVKNYGGTNLDYTKSLILNKYYDAVYLSGAFAVDASFDSLSVSSVTNSQDVFVAKVDTTGDVLWAIAGGGLYDDDGNGVAVDTFGGVYVAGSFYNSSAAFGTVNVSGYGTYDAFSGKICPLSAQVVKTDVSCHGGSNGSIIVTPDGGTPPYTFTWLPNISTNDTVLNLPAGTFNVTITDYNGCSADKQIIIEEPSALDVTATGHNISCYNQNNGTAVAVATGGTPTYSYSWNTIPVQTNDTAFNLAQGAFKVIVTDAHGCKDSASVNIVNPSAVLAFAGIDKSICSGNNVILGDTPVASGGTSPYHYKWTPATYLNNDTLANSVATPTANITYTLKVTDNNGCTANDIINVTISQPPAVMISQSDTLCVGETTNLAANASGALSYTWAPAASLNNALIQMPVASPTITTTYSVTVSFTGNCYNTASVKIVVYNLPQITTSGDQSVCFGDSIVLSASASGAVSYAWQPAGLLYDANLSSPQTHPLSMDVAFIVVVTDNHACVSRDTIDITVNSIPTPTITENSGVLTSNYAVGNQWYLDGILISGATGQNYTPLQNGSYTVEITLNNCSGLSVPYTVVNVGVNNTESDLWSNIYPNPTNGILNLDLIIPNANNVSVDIKDILGRTLISEELKLINSKVKTYFDMNGLRNGIYLIEMRKGESLLLNKIIFYYK